MFSMRLGLGICRETANFHKQNPMDKINFRNSDCPRMVALFLIFKLL